MTTFLSAYEKYLSLEKASLPTGPVAHGIERTESVNDNEWLDYAGYKHHTRKCGAVEYAGVSTLPHTYEADEGIATPIDKVTGA